MPKLLDDEWSTNKIIQTYLDTKRDCSQDTLHGAFFDICINSTDSKLFEVSNLRVHQCMDIAKKMGIKAIVFHTNYIVNFRLQSYLNSWLDRNEEYWRQIIREYPEQIIYIENMFDDSPDLLTSLAERMQDEPRFSVCLDIAHAFISGTSLDTWLKKLKPYVAHIHINDNDGIEDLHLPVGNGILNWNDFTTWGKSLKATPSILFEVRSFHDLQKSVEYMKANHIYPFL